MNALTGQCACGKVELKLTLPTLFASYCHCETCRRVHAAPFVAWTAVRSDAVAIDGADALHNFESSPGVVRAFCSACGTHVLYRGEFAPDRIYIPVAILNDIDRTMESHVSYEEQPRWFRGLDRLPCYEAKSDTKMGWR